ncbi:sigma factor [Janthinobacterium sp. UMAB-56]|uniref:sigma factor n=1 Tax=Janthinobacterium sp. UMAB-56 TaxID=1365361 RepID=UPI00214C27F9|nr:sigma factor [Janthinobacterium sp. UMAB-56]
MSAVSPIHAIHLETLYSEHHGWLYGWLRGKLGNRAEAADLAQDTFLRLLGKRQAAPLRETRGYLEALAQQAEPTSAAQPRGARPDQYLFEWHGMLFLDRQDAQCRSRCGNQR